MSTFDPLNSRNTLIISGTGHGFAATTGFACKDSGGNTIANVKDRATCCQQYGVPCPDGKMACYGDKCSDGSIAGSGSAPTPSSIQFLDRLGLGSLKLPPWALPAGAVIAIILIIIGIAGSKGRR